jgi:hypothetical protein
MTSLVQKAGAWCNGEVAYLAWQVAKKIDGCLGFMVTRVHETGADAGQRRVLPTWIAFTDQSNPDWQAQDSSVWPIQSFEWRDLTLRKSRDTTKVRPIDFRVHYEIVPVGTAGPGRKAEVYGNAARTLHDRYPWRKRADRRHSSLWRPKRGRGGDVHERNPVDAEPSAATP